VAEHNLKLGRGVVATASIRSRLRGMPELTGRERGCSELKSDVPAPQNTAAVLKTPQSISQDWCLPRQ
jgi:hypothetical protein